MLRTTRNLHEVFTPSLFVVVCFTRARYVAPGFRFEFSGAPAGGVDLEFFTHNCDAPNPPEWITVQESFVQNRTSGSVHGFFRFLPPRLNSVVCVCVCVCARARARACARAHMSVLVRSCVHVRMYVHAHEHCHELRPLARC